MVYTPISESRCARDILIADFKLAAKCSTILCFRSFVSHDSKLAEFVEDIRITCRRNT